MASEVYKSLCSFKCLRGVFSWLFLLHHCNDILHQVCGFLLVLSLQLLQVCSGLASHLQVQLGGFAWALTLLAFHCFVVRPTVPILPYQLPSVTISYPSSCRSFFAYSNHLNLGLLLLLLLLLSCFLPSKYLVTCPSLIHSYYICNLFQSLFFNICYYV